MAEVIPPLFYRGWNHDPRFYQIYLPSLLVMQWASERIGRWLSPGYAVVLQDFTVALLVALPVALLLARWRTWQRNGRLRTLVATSSLTLPWFGVVRPWENPQDYAAAVFTLIASYFVTLGGATLGPFSRGMRRALLAIAFTTGATVVMWRLDPWQWLYAGSLVASLLLVLYAAVRSRLVEVEAA
jgi:hypothetical protein